MPKGRSKPAVQELDDDDLELMEEVEETKPAKKTKTVKAEPEPKAESTGYGVSWLAEYVNEELNTEYTAAQMRVVLRKMAKDGDLEREVGTDRARYQFTGENDRIVRAVLKRVSSGEVDEAKRERLAAAKSGKSSANRKAKAEVVEEIEDVKPTRKRKSAPVEEIIEEARPKPKVTRKRNA